MVSELEVERQIKNEIPTGSTKDQVISFLDRVEINGVKIQHHGYIPVEPEGTVTSGGDQYILAGLISGTMRTTAYDEKRFQVYRIHLDFYFDRGERLKNYQLRTLGDW